jgi:hypothetical protein
MHRKKMNSRGQKNGGLKGGAAADVLNLEKLLNEYRNLDCIVVIIFGNKFLVM